MILHWIFGEGSGEKLGRLQGWHAGVSILGRRRADQGTGVTGSPGRIWRESGQLEIVGINCTWHFNNLAALALAG